MANRANMRRLRPRGKAKKMNRDLRTLNRDIEAVKWKSFCELMEILQYTSNAVSWVWMKKNYLVTFITVIR